MPLDLSDLMPPDFLARPHIVFVSHSGQDYDEVKRLLLPELQQSFWDFHCENSLTRATTSVSETYRTSILRSLSRCGPFMLIWSRNSALSKWVGFEIESATRMQKPMFLLRLGVTPIVALSNTFPAEACSEFNFSGVRRAITWLQQLCHRNDA
jgi:hypothetical protein